MKDRCMVPVFILIWSTDHRFPMTAQPYSKLPVLPKVKGWLWCNRYVCVVHRLCEAQLSNHVYKQNQQGQGDMFTRALRKHLLEINYLEKHASKHNISSIVLSGVLIGWATITSLYITAYGLLMRIKMGSRFAANLKDCLCAVLSTFDHNSRSSVFRVIGKRFYSLLL